MNIQNRGKLIPYHLYLCYREGTVFWAWSDLEHRRAHWGEHLRGNVVGETEERTPKLRMQPIWPTLDDTRPTPCECPPFPTTSHQRDGGTTSSGNVHGGFWDRPVNGVIGSQPIWPTLLDKSLQLVLVEYHHFHTFSSSVPFLEQRMC